MKNEEIYMLRCWKDSTNSSWRFGIKDIKSGKSKFFRSVTDLKKHLDSFENQSDSTARPQKIRSKKEK